MFELLQNVEKHLHGQWQYRSTNPEYKNGVAIIIEILRRGYVGQRTTPRRIKEWLFTSTGELVQPADISRHELDTTIYGEVKEKSEIYDLLGFKKTNQDKRKELVEELFSRYSSAEIDSIIESLVPEETEDVFDPDVDDDYVAFPEESIKDLQRLKNTTKERYFKAPKVNYEKVLRRIRTSRRKDKEHIRYRYKGYCQICETPNRYWEVTEIFKNPDKELEQMNLSLCPSCATEYRILRNNNGSIMQQFAHDIISANIAVDPCIEFGEKYIRFTKAHLAEIQEVLKLDVATKNSNL